MKDFLTLLQQHSISCSFSTLLVGIKYNIIDDSAATNYAVQYLLDNPHETNPKITELACINRRTSDVDILLADALKAQFITIEPETDAWFIEERKLRFCLY